MPYRPKRPCSYTGCPELTNRRYCEKHQKEIDKQYNKERQPLMKRRYGRAWKRIRDRYIKANPLCEECLKNNKTNVANEVHHIIPLSKGGDSSNENLMSLCTSCHSTITAKEGDRWQKKTAR
ncbi:MAG: HNH endonuclease signature motif containing protein [Desulfitobacterium hafniense]|nr:HNH endonuclease signature motif containing protein [Desulfitobacterium hafniense]